jgi:hypothetical protein
MRADAAERTEHGTTILVCLAAWLVPGGGHLWLGRRVKGFILLAALIVMFGLGLALQGRLFPFEFSQPLVGLAAFGDLVRASAAATRPVSFEVHALAVHGDQVLAEWTITVEARAGGRRIRWRGMSVAAYRADGRIATWREYWNPADLAAAST